MTPRRRRGRASSYAAYPDYVTARSSSRGERLLEIVRLNFA